MTDERSLAHAGPSRPSQLSAFVAACEARLGRTFADDRAFDDWADLDIRAFWQLFVEWSGVRLGGTVDVVCTTDDPATATFFPDATLNAAAEILHVMPAAEDRPAVVAISEDGRRIVRTRAELRTHVEQIAGTLVGLGVRAGDRVVAITRNTEEPVAVALACAAIGAAWSAVAPDLGTEAALARFEPLQPTLLFVHAAQQLHGARRDLSERIIELARGLPSLRALVVMDANGDAAPPLHVPVVALSAATAAHPPLPMAQWPRHPFNQPLYILFSSGTTGRPKCIVHGAGGTLLEHLKEHRLHGDVGPDDIMLFQTTCGWMMWHWQVSALATGATIVTYDGSVSFPESDALLRHVAAEHVTRFGTSSAYLQFCQDAVLDPRVHGDLAHLRAIYSTGSILYEHQFEWVARAFPPVSIQSISGGTDIIGCFVLGHPHRAVMSGDSQSIGLAMAVRAWDGTSVASTGVGELVCIRPFPSRPVYLWGDDDGARFRSAYFYGPPGMWMHGDRLRLYGDGRARILGRTDGTLNVLGVRIGPAEIYEIVLRFPEIAEAMAVEQRAPRAPGGSRLVLLLVMAAGHQLDRPLTLRLKRALSTQASPNHVPAVVAAVSALPMTLNGKRSEAAARSALNGEAAPNRSALANPRVLEELSSHPDLMIHG